MPDPAGGTANYRRSLDVVLRTKPARYPSMRRFFFVDTAVGDGGKSQDTLDAPEPRDPAGSGLFRPLDLPYEFQKQARQRATTDA
jgi:hypothetical protein